MNLMGITQTQPPHAGTQRKKPQVSVAAESATIA